MKPRKASCKTERNIEIYLMRKNGCTFSEIALKFSISISRVAQINRSEIWRKRRE